MDKGRWADRNKLSWIYRNKKRLGKTKKTVNNNGSNRDDDQKARIVVKNLSFKTTKEDLQTLYEPFGQIQYINIPKRFDGKPIGCAFIEFEKFENASKAIFKTNKHEFLGRPISCTWAIQKLRYEKKDKQNDKLCDSNLEKKNKTNYESSIINENDVEIEPQVAEKLQRPKQKFDINEKKALKMRKNFKRARIIVRNLSFKAKENDLINHFRQYGNVVEVKILTDDTGKRTGCAFVQFDRVQCATKALHYSNMKVICDRPVVVDWAIPKQKFKKNDENHELLEDNSESMEEIKQESNDEFTESCGYDCDVKDESDGNSKNSNCNGHDTDYSEDTNESDDSDNDDHKTDNKDLIEEDKVEDLKKSRVISYDVREGKTIFLKNVPFSTTNNDIKALMQQFGPVYYALICIDKLTEHSKGTAFVKFRNIEDAEKCLLAEKNLLRLCDQILEPHRALGRNEISAEKISTNKMMKDSRNLYLVKEGVIVAGTPAAVGVSATDMKKRLQLEQWKSQMLKNLNMFVSRVRMVIHNLPESVDNSMLKNIFKKYSSTNAIIKEARVMRDMKSLDAKGVGKSKGYGFVTFTTHDDALTTLRNINNNPKIFSKAMRPIVAFSIENRVIVNVKKRRIEKSRQNNYSRNSEHVENNIDKREKSNKPRIKKLRVNSLNQHIDDKAENFSGITSKPGHISKKLPLTHTLKSQVLLYHKTLKHEKKIKKNEKNIKILKDQAIQKKEMKRKQKERKVTIDERNFNQLISQYKSKLTSRPSNFKSKWYDT